MSKKNKLQKSAANAARPSGGRSPLLSRRGKITIGSGIGVVALGFFLVTLTDPAGQNWASNLCPFVILGGYAMIGIGIVLPDPEPTEKNAPSPQPTTHGQ